MSDQTLEQMTKAHFELIAENVRLREALQEILNNPWEDNCLDPQWAARIAKEALRGIK